MEVKYEWKGVKQTMKAMHIWGGVMGAWLLLAGGSWPAFGQEIKVGDTTARVRETLGQPAGYIQCADSELFLYDRGRLEARNGIVTSVDLISAEQAQLSREQSQYRRAEGQRILAQRQADPAFLAQPASQQVAFWEVFRSQYPEVDVEAPYVAALQRQQKDLDDAALKQKVADLEQQVAAAQDSARLAQSQTAEYQTPAPYVSSVPAFTYPTVYTYPYLNTCSPLITYSSVGFCPPVTFSTGTSRHNEFREHGDRRFESNHMSEAPHPPSGFNFPEPGSRGFSAGTPTSHTAHFSAGSNTHPGYHDRH